MYKSSNKRLGCQSRHVLALYVTGLKGPRSEGLTTNRKKNLVKYNKLYEKQDEKMH
jgi:hypothetical protein